MSRTGYFFAAIGLGLLGCVWLVMLSVFFVSNAVGKDSLPGATIYDVTFIIDLILWVAIFLSIVSGAWLCLKRAFRPPRKILMNSSPAMVPPPQSPNLTTSDEKPAHLVKKS